MKISLEIDTANPFTEHDKTILLAIANGEIAARDLPSGETIVAKAAETVNEGDAVVNVTEEQNSVVSASGAVETTEEPSTLSEAGEAAVELDAAGMPWHSEIHAGTRTKTTKGLWKKRKGTPPAKIAEVEAQLRQQMLDSTEGEFQMNAAGEAEPVTQETNIFGPANNQTTQQEPVNNTPPAGDLIPENLDFKSFLDQVLSVETQKNPNWQVEVLVPIQLEFDSKGGLPDLINVPGLLQNVIKKLNEARA